MYSCACENVIVYIFAKNVLQNRKDITHVCLVPGKKFLLQISPTVEVHNIVARCVQDNLFNNTIIKYFNFFTFKRIKPNLKLRM